MFEVRRIGHATTPDKKVESVPKETSAGGVGVWLVFLLKYQTLKSVYCRQQERRYRLGETRRYLLMRLTLLFTNGLVHKGCREQTGNGH